MPIFAPSKSFCQLLNILPTNHIYTERVYLEFSCIELCFTDQYSAPLEVLDRINLTFGINVIGMSWDNQLILEMYVKDHGPLSFAEDMVRNHG